MREKRSDQHATTCFKLRRQIFLEICDEYPQWKRALINRAISRRAYFQTVKDDARKVNELILKIRREEKGDLAPYSLSHEEGGGRQKDEKCFDASVDKDPSQ